MNVASHLSKRLLLAVSRSAVVCCRAQVSTSAGAAFKDFIRRPTFPPIIRGYKQCAATLSTQAIRMPEQTNRVLSIQSHVVHGYVGNKSATFPLQVLGFEVDPINSVHFSNHTGYDFIKGQVLSDIDLGDVFSGLEQNNLLDAYTHLLTGYIGKDSFLHQVRDIVKKMRQANPNLVYVCDPVLGDNGHMYVPEGLLPIYQDEIIPLADICTPNQFEVELLTGHKLESISDTWKSLLWFHNRGVQTVVLSSTDMGGEGTLLTFLSHKKGNERLKYTISIPKQGNGINFTGTGDLFASLFLAHSTLAHDLGAALQNTVATVQSVIERTLDQMPDEVRNSPSTVTSRQRELKIIQSKADIEHPKVSLLAVEEPPEIIKNCI